MQKEITLQFKSIDDLWSFRVETLIEFISMNKNECQLTCKCSEQQMQLAITKYRAIVVVVVAVQGE